MIAAKPDLAADKRGLMTDTIRKKSADIRGSDFLPAFLPWRC